MKEKNNAFWAQDNFSRKGKNATLVTKKIYKIYGEDVVADKTVRKGLDTFKASEFSIKDQKHWLSPHHK